MAIQCRHGAYEDFKPDKMVTAEWATVTSGDPNTTDGKASYHCFAPGDVKRMATYDDIKTDIDSATKDVQAAFSEQMTAATNAANTAASDAQVAKEAAEEAATKADTATNAANTAAENATTAADAAQEIISSGVSKSKVEFTAQELAYLQTGETLATLIGKIETWLEALKSAANYDVSNDLTQETAGAKVLDAYQGKVLDDKITSLTTGKMDAIAKFTPKGIWCASFTRSNYTGQTSVILTHPSGITLERGELNNWFGTKYTKEEAKAHFVAFAMNADGISCPVHISGVQWSNDALYAVAESSLNGCTFRINWCVILI